MDHGLNREMSIRELRQQLIRARQECDPDLLQYVLDGVSSLAGDGYRCCLVDYSACKPAAYVRVVGFEQSRVRAQLEFPIDPGLRTEQLLPLSHLADYEEAANSDSIKRIYDGVSAYVHQPEAELLEDESRAIPGTQKRLEERAVAERRKVRKQRSRSGRGKSRTRMPRSHLAWWCFAASLMVVSLTIFARASVTFM